MISAEKVNATFLDCLYKPEEVPDGKSPDGTVVADGVMGKIGFHPGRLKSHREDVRALLNELPDNFHRSKGDGWSFLNACMDKNGEQWGEHKTVNELLCLGLGLKFAGYCLPREMWPSLPGGMPYFWLDTEEKKDG